MHYEEFGIYLKSLRIDADMTLRSFAEASDYDVSNLSKIERGILPPPPGNLLLRKWANLLGLAADSTGYQLFMDLAAVTRSKTPDGVSQKEAAQYLPAFYRTLRNKRKDQQSYNRLIELLKKS